MTLEEERKFNILYENLCAGEYLTPKDFDFVMSVLYDDFQQKGKQLEKSGEICQF